ncbi:hypothetical protein ACNPMX_11715 [Stenotrophomonas maltophilia]
MTTSVDVLAAIDAAIEGIHGEGYECRDLEDAYGAVVELIEAVGADLRGENFGSSDEKRSDYLKRRRQERNRVANALASVKGA